MRIAQGFGERVLVPRRGGGVYGWSNQLRVWSGSCYFCVMGTLAEIEAAVASLPPGEQRELFLYLATLLHIPADALPSLLEISRDEIDGWIADDDEGMMRFREGY